MAHQDPPRSLPLIESAMLVAAGGFLDGFTYIGHGHVFANNMTGNLVLLGVEAVDGSWFGALQHLTPIIAFLVGVAAARAIVLRHAVKRIVPSSLAVLLLEIVALLLLGFLPPGVPNLSITFSIAFVAATQVETFRRVNGESFNSTFMTGDLRTLSEGLFDWIFSPSDPATWARTRDFAVICAIFLVGATVGGLAVSRLGNRALWIAAAPLLIVLLRLWNAGRKQPQ
jgi:uncharacterized membrane protein YoaK (UPF0700 family)